MKFLIDTIPFDEHASAVEWALKRRGHSTRMLHLTDHPAILPLSLHLQNGRTSFGFTNLAGETFSEAFDVALTRRRRPNNLSSSLAPADVEFAKRQSQIISEGLYPYVDVKGMWVNPPASRRNTSLKPLQLALAARSGLQVPDTLISNSFEDVVSFCRQQGGKVAFKPLEPGTWTNGAGSSWFSYTVVLDQAELERQRASIEASAGIYQHYVEKAFELRVVVMGRSCFSARLDSQDHADTMVDWRHAHHSNADLRASHHALDQAIQDACFEFMDAMDLVFGVFDFAVGKDGKTYFLEVNPMGQFLFLDTISSLPLLQIFADFLESNDPRFAWQGSDDPVRFADFWRSAEKTHLYEHVYPRHTPVPLGSFLYVE
ncbi:hypothetical protein [Caulobacter sp. 1776]|uniref:hypothetical protein n=1 Tax=Caulobacter sp. 1776 TaxID=3156420 RepID=UPI0033918B0B